MLGLRKISPNAPHSDQSAVAYVCTSPNSFPSGFDACVTRITPTGMRLALKVLITTPVDEFFALNRFVEVELKLPGPLGRVRTKGSLVGVAANFAKYQAPMILDLEFVELTESEEKVLRDSNPSLVVA